MKSNIFCYFLSHIKTCYKQVVHTSNKLILNALFFVLWFLFQVIFSMMILKWLSNSNIQKKFYISSIKIKIMFRISLFLKDIIIKQVIDNFSLKALTGKTFEKWLLQICDVAYVHKCKRYKKTTLQNPIRLCVKT